MGNTQCPVNKIGSEWGDVTRSVNEFKNVNDFSAKKVLVLLAHPDDEVYIPGILKNLIDRNHEVHAMFLTSGKLGSDLTSATSTPEELGTLRESEGTTAMGYLGVTDVYFLRQDDDSLNELNVLSAIDTSLSGTDIDVILTFNHTGLYGHDEHIGIHRFATQYFRQTDSVQNLYYFDVPYSDIISSVGESVGGDITYVGGQSYGVSDDTIDFTYKMSASDLTAMENLVDTYVSQFDQSKRDIIKGHVNLRPYEYLINGSKKSGVKISNDDMLNILFNV